MGARPSIRRVHYSRDLKLGIGPVTLLGIFIATLATGSGGEATDKQTGGENTPPDSRPVRGAIRALHELPFKLRWQHYTHSV